jgi:hypothetical protein
MGGCFIRQNEIENCQSALLLQRGLDEEFLRRAIVLYAQNIRLAARLAILDVALSSSRGLIHAGGVPLATSSALKASLHPTIIPYLLSLIFYLSEDRSEFMETHCARATNARCPIIAGLSFSTQEAS